MSRRNRIKAMAVGKVEEGVKLDVAVAQDIRVGGSALFVLLQEGGKDIIPVFLNKVDSQQRKIQPFCD